MAEVQASAIRPGCSALAFERAPAGARSLRSLFDGVRPRPAEPSEPEGAPGRDSSWERVSHARPMAPPRPACLLFCLAQGRPLA